MIIQREEFYFEPRVVDWDGSLRWYGEKYLAPELRTHGEETVYIRDSGSELFIYSLSKDELEDETQINATFYLICKIKKHNELWKYGRKNK